MQPLPHSGVRETLPGAPVCPFEKHGHPVRRENNEPRETLGATARCLVGLEDKLLSWIGPARCHRECVQPAWPEAQEMRQIERRITDRCNLPVDNRCEVARFAEQQVAHVEVTMEEPHHARTREVGAKPSAEQLTARGNGWVIVSGCAVGLEQPQPPACLTFVPSVRTAQTSQAKGVHVYAGKFSRHAPDLACEMRSYERISADRERYFLGNVVSLNVLGDIERVPHCGGICLAPD